MIPRFTHIAAAAIVACLATPALAQSEAPPVDPAPAEPAAALTADSAVTLTLSSSSDIERRLVSYQCDDGAALPVQYINAAPNFLAILPVNGENHLFATALAASGARYVSGPYEWWDTGDDATLRDLTEGDDATPLFTCSAISNTP